MNTFGQNQNQSNSLGNSNNTQWGMNNEQPNNINSGYGQTNTQPQTYNIFGNNNALQNNPNLALCKGIKEIIQRGRVELLFLIYHKKGHISIFGQCFTI